MRLAVYLMRLKPSICAIFIVCSTLAYSHPVDAQEGKAQPEIEVTSLRSDPDPVLIESESRASKPTSLVVKEAPRDSAQIKLAKPFKSIEKVQKEEEDPLSFNFLYYIIEKFKMSDIIE